MEGATRGDRHRTAGRLVRAGRVVGLPAVVGKGGVDVHRRTVVDDHVVGHALVRSTGGRGIVRPPLGGGIEGAGIVVAQRRAGIVKGRAVAVGWGATGAAAVLLAGDKGVLVQGERAGDVRAPPRIVVVKVDTKVPAAAGVAAQGHVVKCRHRRAQDAGVFFVLPAEDDRARAPVEGAVVPKDGTGCGVAPQGQGGTAGAEFGVAIVDLELARDGDIHCQGDHPRRRVVDEQVVEGGGRAPADGLGAASVEGDLPALAVEGAVVGPVSSHAQVTARIRR